MAGFRRDKLAEHFIDGDRVKATFDSFRQAQDEADERNDNRAEGERPWHAYKCGYCDGFHVGHSNPRRRRR